MSHIFNFFIERRKVMFIKSLDIVNFRNYDNISINFGKKINILYGDNAQGKTNLLESIYFLALTKSHRSFIDDNLIKYGEKFSRLTVNIDNNGLNKELKIVLSPTTKKLFVDNNNYKKISDYISNMNVIIFYPDDLELVKGGPLVRRRYINLELSQLYSGYMDILNDYKKLIRIKNNYLKKIKNGLILDSNYFDTLNDYIIDKSILIYIMRKKFVDKINLYCSEVFKNLSGIDGFFIKYKTSILLDNVLKDDMRKKLKKQADDLLDDEIKYGKNLLGPNFDDFEFYIKDMNIKKFGSQGQQRMAILAIKLSEIEIFKKYLNTSPILLLDDVFSELDNVKKNNLLNYVSSSVQTIITATDLNNFDEKILTEAKLFEIKDGNII